MKLAPALAIAWMIVGCGAAPSAPTIEVGAQPAPAAAATVVPVAVRSVEPTAYAVPEAAELGMIGLLNNGKGVAPVDIGDLGTVPSGNARRLGGGGRKPPQVRAGDLEVKGTLPRKVVKHVLRQNFGRFRLCYELGLKARPDLQGRVTVKLVIEADGAVSGAIDGGSDLPDPAVVNCVVRSTLGIPFPKPDDGKKVDVRYPLIFSPPP